MAPSRAQKRWSGRLRTAGALLSLLGAVGLADAFFGGLGRWELGALLLTAGTILLSLGKRWR